MVKVINNCKRILAVFHPQTWQNDYAINADPEGEVTFDVTDIVLAMSEDKALAIKDDDYDSDDLIHYNGQSPQWMQDWSGPFWVEVEDSIAAYFDAKEKK